MTKFELEEIARQLVLLGERAHVTIAECDVAVARVYPFNGRIENVVGKAMPVSLWQLLQFACK